MTSYEVSITCDGPADGRKCPNALVRTSLPSPACVVARRRVEQNARDIGWQVSRGRAYCPECFKARTTKRHPLHMRPKRDSPYYAGPFGR